MIEVRQCEARHGVDEGKWGLFLDNILLGTSKHRYDADHAKNILMKYLPPDRDTVLKEWAEHWDFLYNSWPI